MEDQVITTTQSTEPIIVESANTSAENTAGLSQVIDQATPMDSNTTYSNLPKVEYQPNMSPTQNLINEAVQTEHAINQESNAGKAMNSFLTQGYDYDKNEAGSYWVAGAINDNNTQMSFLQTLINEEMYDEMDLQKYYYDTNLATARAYAAQKGKETAYGFYRAAQERALAEGELTGWYMPAEGRYLLGQYTVAQNTLENPDATPEEISKANRVAKAAESWFSANQITTRGIKCLAMMNYEENVRHNTVMGELQKQANDIAARGAAASGAAAQLQLRELKFQVEEMELQTGYDFSNAIGLDNDNYLGHKREDYQDLQALRGYSSTADMLMNDSGSYAAVLGASSKEFIDQTLRQAGKNPQDAYDNYRASVGDSGVAQSVEDNKQNVLAETYLNTETYQVAEDSGYGHLKDKHIYTFTSTEDGKPVTKAYIKTNEGYYKQIKDPDLKITGNTTIGEKINSFSTTDLTYNGNKINVGGYRYNELAGSVSKDSDTYRFGWTTQNETAQKKEKEGYHINSSVYYRDKSFLGGSEDCPVMENADGEMIYITSDGKTHKIEDPDTVKANPSKLETKTYTESSTGKDIKIVTDMPVNFRTLDDENIENSDDYGVYIDGKGKTRYFRYTKFDVGRNAVSYGWTEITEEELKTAGMADRKDYILNSRATYSEGNKFKGGKNSDTIAQEAEGKNKIDTPTVSGGTSGGSEGRNVDKTTYNPEDREAVFKKYSVDPIERREYIDILDPKELEKKLQSRYNNVLGMGGDQNGK